MLFEFFLLTVLAQYHATAEPANDDYPLVDSEFGQIAGKYIDDVAVFTSIQYGDDVSGDNRWKDSKLYPSWKENNIVWNATVTAPGCPQSCTLPNPDCNCPTDQEENCLFLNVYAPKHAITNNQLDNKLPVLVFFHGGAFIQGYAGSPLYDGRFLVSKTDIILVTPNYRLNALGYLVYGTEDDSTDITGNLGLKDQILSLRWVKKTIGSFGGDPDRVTIAGQSAGAISSALIMAKQEELKLLHQVIIASDPMGVPIGKDSKFGAHKLGRRFAKELGCYNKLWPWDESYYDCLYNIKNLTKIINAAKAVAIPTPLEIFEHGLDIFELFLRWAPVVDHQEVSEQTLNAFEDGTIPKLPLLMGVTANEALIFLNGLLNYFGKEIKKQQYTDLLHVLFKLSGMDFLETNYDKVKSMYPPVDKRNNILFVVSKMLSDRAFYCPTRRAGQVYFNQTEQLPEASVYQYVFDHSLPFEDAWSPVTLCADKSVSCHGAELPYVFGTLSLCTNGKHTFTEDETKLSNSMMEYWGNFVKYGNPNGPNLSKKAESHDHCHVDESCINDQTDLLQWPKYKHSKWKSMMFRIPENEIVEDYHGKNCDLWDKIGYSLD